MADFIRQVDEEEPNQFPPHTPVQCCPVCYETYPAPSFGFQIPGCDHWFCKECIKTYFQQKISTMGAGNSELRCLDGSCGQKIQDTFLSQVVSEEYFRKHLRFKRAFEIHTNPSLKWCCRPGCETPVHKPQTSSTPAVCPECGTRMCFKCGNEFHGRSSCQQRMEANDPAYQQWAEEANAHYCPRCLMRVEKASGCDAMSCTLCNHKWCYKCGSLPFSPVHHFICTKGIDYKNKKVKYCSIICSSFWILIAIIVLIPLGVLASPFVATIALWASLCGPHRRRYHHYRPKRSVCECICRFIAGVILTPLVLAGTPIIAAIIGFFLLIVLIILWFYSLLTLGRIQKYISTR